MKRIWNVETDCSKERRLILVLNNLQITFVSSRNFLWRHDHMITSRKLWKFTHLVTLKALRRRIHLRTERPTGGMISWLTRMNSEMELITTTKSNLGWQHQCNSSITKCYSILALSLLRHFWNSVAHKERTALRHCANQTACPDLCVSNPIAHLLTGMPV